MLTIAILIAVAWLLSTSWVRRAIPAESAVAFAMVGAVMVGLLLMGRLV
jgi:hypothetical protein